MTPADARTLIVGAARAVRSLAPALSRQDLLAPHLRDARHAEGRGYFTPEADLALRQRFGRYLTARAALLQTIDELLPLARAAQRESGGGASAPPAPGETTYPARRRLDAEPDAEQRPAAFLVAYTAACLLVRAGRFVLQAARDQPALQAKLDEAEPALGIPRKQFTAIYRSLTSPRHAWLLHDARRYADEQRDALRGCASGDPELEPLLELLAGSEQAIRLPTRRYLLARLSYRWHSLRRRHASAYRQAMFAVFEGVGRVVAELRNPWRPKRVDGAVRRRLTELLEPGDVIITRHDEAMSNLLLPGFWPHAALHVGDERTARALGVEVDSERAGRWREPNTVLEARKDGVLLRSLDDTLEVDSVVVIRPRLERGELGQALSRALLHEGKLYDFEFDFRRSDRLVCTEVVYRAYHGLGPVTMELTTRAGRPTFSAEDLLDLALGGEAFVPVALFGVPGVCDDLVTGAAVRGLLARSYGRDVPPC